VAKGEAMMHNSNYQVSMFEDPFKTYRLIEHHTNSWFVVVPERGGIMISLGFQGKELMYLDRKTFIDKTENVRGGTPILFPICGPLNHGQYEWNQQTYAMKNHGFARTAVWEVVETSTQGEASITLKLTSNDESNKSFPFDFELLFKYSLKNGALTIEQTYKNRSSQDMPFYAGFHPYFLTDSKHLPYQTDAETYYDYNDDLIKSYQGSIDLFKLPESIVFLDAREPEISFPVNNNTRIHLRYGEHFKYIVLWTVPDNNFICVEPWMAKAGEMHNKEELVYIAPNTTLNTYFNISIT
jgi:galactose mutarotase-like enzyme